MTSSRKLARAQGDKICIEVKGKNLSVMISAARKCPQQACSAFRQRYGCKSTTMSFKHYRGKIYLASELIVLREINWSTLVKLRCSNSVAQELLDYQRLVSCCRTLYREASELIERLEVTVDARCQVTHHTQDVAPLSLPKFPWVRCEKISLEVENLWTPYICRDTRKYLNQLLIQLGRKLSRTKPLKILMMENEEYYPARSPMRVYPSQFGTVFSNRRRSQDIIGVMLDILVFENRHPSDEPRRLTGLLKEHVASAPFSDTRSEILDMVLRQPAYLELFRCNNPVDWYGRCIL